MFKQLCETHLLSLWEHPRTTLTLKEHQQGFENKSDRPQQQNAIASNLNTHTHTHTERGGVQGTHESLDAVD
eukprot:375331-Amphidinium_carterae.1